MHKEILRSDKCLTLSDWTTFTNMKAMLSNAGEGGTIYPDFVPFTVDELMKHIGIYFLNGVSPSPQVEQKLSPQEKDPINGNDMVYNCLGKFAMGSDLLNIPFFTILYIF